MKANVKSVKSRGPTRVARGTDNSTKLNGQVDQIH